MKKKKPKKELAQFFKQYRENRKAISALSPTSPFAGRELASEMAQQTGPRRVLEVGAGTGSISAQIACLLGPDDELWLVEFNEQFVNYLKKRVAKDSAFNGIRENTHFFAGNILDFPLDQVNQPFDFIISSLPFNSFPPDFVQAVFDLYQELLSPEGSLSYIEYFGGRTLKKLFKPTPERSASNAITEEAKERYEFRKKVVVGNLPPAWIHHLRFEQQ
jgi:phosphatidylserine decarboxylase